MKKCKRGLKKWRRWNFKNIQDAGGNVGTSPEDNARAFQSYYQNLYTNQPTPPRPDNSGKWYAEMPDIPTDREWGEPMMHELMTATRDARNTAAGLSGIPVSVWVAIARDDKLSAELLNVMKKCWREEVVPSAWTRSYMTVLEKDGDLSLSSQEPQRHSDR